MSTSASKMPPAPVDSMAIETTCVTIAKGRQHLRDILANNAQVDGKPWKGGAYALQKALNRDFKTNFWNGLVRVSANDGQALKAERWMNRLDLKQGISPEMGTFNAFLEVLLKNGSFDKADEWFQRPHQAALHPELADFRPGASSYDVMIQMTAKANDVVRAERYLHAAFTRGLRLHRDSCLEVVRSLLRNSESRRAHVLMEDFIARGCSKFPNYSPEALRNELKSLRSLRKFDPDVIVALVESLAESLASSGNVVSANRWLRYLFEAGSQPAQHQKTWDIVRAATPYELVPALLSCEVKSSTAKPEAAKLLPALLSGEHDTERPERPLPPRLSLALTDASRLEGEVHASVTFSRPESRASTRPESKLAVYRPGSKAESPDLKRRPISQVSTRAGSSLAHEAIETPRAESRQESSPRRHWGEPRSPAPPDVSRRGEKVFGTSQQLQRLLRSQKRTEEVAAVCTARRLAAETAKG